jgi:flagellar biosynthesis/type III secretory pathway protein FliH
MGIKPARKVDMLDFWLAPLVVAARMPRVVREAQQLALGQPMQADRLETERMVTEKVQARQQGMEALARESVRTGMALGLAAAFGNVAAATQTLAAAPGRLARASLRPARRRVRANVRRLSRRSP